MKRMKTGVDDGDGVRLRPWWRSVGFWLGLWGLVFLGWVWRDSIGYGWVVGSEMRVEGRGFSMEQFEPEWCVQAGKVFYRNVRVMESGPGMVVTREPLRYERRSGSYLVMNGMGSRCGYEVMVWEVVSPPPVRAKVVEWWVSIWMLVAGYVVVWLGLMVMWRWWVRRRFARVVGMVR